MVALVQAIPEVERRTGKQPIVIGGLAVICRLGGGYRATSDLDTVNRRSVGEPAQLQVLISSGAAATDAAGVMIPTAAGEVKVDVLEVGDWELEPLPEDPTDRLHVQAHAWAADTATPLIISARADPRADIPYEVMTRVAEPGPLIAMKLQSVEDRSKEKAGTDLLDIVRLVLDDATRDMALAQLEQAKHLVADVELHARRWFTSERERSLQRIRAIPEGADVDDATLDVVAALLLSS